MKVGSKGWTAGISVIIALIGVVAKLRWLTVVALVGWLVAMIFFGVGNRRVDQSKPPSKSQT